MPTPFVPRSLSLGSALAAALITLTVTLTGVGMGPAQASPEGDLKAAVARVQAQMEANAARLEAATASWERGRAALDRSLQTDLNAGFALDASQERVRRAQEALDAFANSAYRQPLSPGVVGMFRGDLMAYHNFNVVQRGLNRGATDQRAMIKALQDSRASAEDLAASTGAIASRAQREQVRLDAALEALRGLAAEDEAELQVAVAELEELRARYVPVFTGPGGCGALPGESFANGFLPPGALCPLQTAPGHSLQPAAAASFDAMSAAYQESFGPGICVTDSYRDYASQVDVYQRKPGLAATPGRSNHGLGLAVDLCGGIQTFSSPAHQWMIANAPRFGWIHPAWAQAGGSKPEAWHWEFIDVQHG